MTPSQQALIEARKQRLARFANAAAKIQPRQSAMVRPVIQAAPIVETFAAPVPHPVSSPALIPKDTMVSIIQDMVCDFYRVALTDMLSERRHAKISLPRQVAMYLCNQFTDLSLTKIGKMFGNRDRTTVLKSYRRIDFLLENDTEIAAIISMLTKRIQSRS
jgi:chromosomal replication initiation ATPase DnaA